jgi:restriction system protein
MTIPDFQSVLLPYLKLVGDKQEHDLNEIIDSLAEQFRLSETDKKEMLASGTQARFDNRVAWAGTHLRKAKLIDSTGRGKVKITDRGERLLKSSPHGLSARDLRQFPEFVEFQNRSRTPNSKVVEQTDEHGQTPAEILEASYKALRNDLALELLERVRSCSPRFFEALVVDLLVRMGYGGSREDAGQAVGQSGDGGIDGIIKEDKLGLDAVYVQAKRWEAAIGRPVVQAFAGSLEGQRARKGILITTSQFSNDARDYVTRIEKRIVLIDGAQLTQLMIDYGVGVSELASYVVKKVDLDYFDTEQ